MIIVPNRIKVILAVFFVDLVAFAAPGNPPPPTTPPPPGEPIDGGVFLLLIVSLLFGLYKLYLVNKNRKASNY